MCLDLSMEGRMTLCNMSIEAGAKADLCLLKQGRMATLASSVSQPVAHTLFNGELVYSA